MCKYCIPSETILINKKRLPGDNWSKKIVKDEIWEIYNQWQQEHNQYIKNGNCVIMHYALGNEDRDFDIEIYDFKRKYGITKTEFYNKLMPLATYYGVKVIAFSINEIVMYSKSTRCTHE